MYANAIYYLYYLESKSISRFYII